jgi:hypothetical protein
MVNSLYENQNAYDFCGLNREKRKLSLLQELGLSR